MPNSIYGEYITINGLSVFIFMYCMKAALVKALHSANITGNVVPPGGQNRSIVSHKGFQELIAYKNV